MMGARGRPQVQAEGAALNRLRPRPVPRGPLEGQGPCRSAMCCRRTAGEQQAACSCICWHGQTLPSPLPMAIEVSEFKQKQRVRLPACLRWPRQRVNCVQHSSAAARRVDAAVAAVAFPAQDRHHLTRGHAPHVASKSSQHPPETQPQAPGAPARLWRLCPEQRPWQLAAFQPCLQGSAQTVSRSYTCLM